MKTFFANEEGVLLIFDDDKPQSEPRYAVRANGGITYYKLVEMNLDDHREFLGINGIRT
jgi:hypothetical protein